VPSPTNTAAKSEALEGIPIPVSKRKKNATVSAENIALLKHVENATTRSVSSTGTPGNRASKYSPKTYHGAHSRACPGG